MQFFTRRPLTVICTVYVLLALIYAWATPPLESSDEYKHFPVVEHIARTGELVVLDPENPGMWLQEGAQPPLYYWLMSFWIDTIDTSDLEQLHEINHHAYVGNPNQLGNKNLILHDPELEAFPWRGSVLAIYLIRFVSIGLGVGTLILAYRLGELLFDRPTGLLAAGLTAVNPMFLFISAAVNNDSLSALLGAWGIYLLIWIWLEQRTADYVSNETTEHERKLHPKLLQYLLLGIVCGLGMLTKLSLASVLLLAGIVFAWEAYRQKAPRLLFVGGLTTFVVAMGMVAPWLWRNIQLYGDLTGLNAFIAVQGTREVPTIWGVNWWAEWGTFYRSYWGLFGGVNVLAPQWFYYVCNGVLVIGLLGWVVEPLSRAKDFEDALIRLRDARQGQRTLWPLVVYIVILFVLLIRWNIISPAFQGRLIFPALTVINVLWAAGLLAWGRWLQRQGYLRNLRIVSRPTFWGTAVTGFIGLMALIIPFTNIAPVYAYPEPLSEVPPEHQFGPYRFRAADGQQISLVGVDVTERQTAVAGTLDGVDITLYWTLEEASVEHNFITAVDVLGRGLESAGRVNRYPGMGVWPPSRWEPGEIYVDHYYIPIDEETETPVQAQIRLGVLDENPKDEHDTAEMIAVSPTGEEIPLVTVGAARLVVARPLIESPQVFTSAGFEDGIWLDGYDMPEEVGPGEELAVTLYWSTDVAPSADYTVFFQLLNADFQQIGGADSPPLNGDYPTSWWLANEQIVETRTVLVPEDAPPGRYTVVVGMYDPVTGVRVPLTAGGDAVMWEVRIE